MIARTSTQLQQGNRSLGSAAGSSEAVCTLGPAMLRESPARGSCLAMMRPTNADGQSRTRNSPPTTIRWSAHSVYVRSEEHTSELQSRLHLVCRLLLEKKK